MEKMRMESINLTEQNIEKVGAMFPNVITEAKDENGKLKKIINFALLKQMLSEDIVDGDEAYEFTWVGKKASLLEAGKPVRKILRPCKDESKDWESTENLYIEGDNLDVLKLLQESYLGAVKMIYIDPPYNTGNDFVYRDDFSMSVEDYDEAAGVFDGEENRLFQNNVSNGRFHSDWCSMLYPRIQLSRNLLSSRGLIFISISDIEVSNLRKMCDEIFGASNFVADLIWANKEGGGSSDSRLFRIKHEHIICYAKQIEEADIVGVPISNEERYKSQDEYVASRGKYYLQKLGMGSIQYSSSLDYPIDTPDGTTVSPADNNSGKKACWRWSRSKYDWGKVNGFIEIKKDSKGIWTVYTKQYMHCDNDGKIIVRTQRPMGIIDEYSSTQASKLLESMNLGSVFNYSKPTGLIQYLLSRIELNNEYVLDFFSGSATTAHSVMKLNSEDNGKRKFIMIQLPELCAEDSEAAKEGYKNICEIGKVRIRRAGEKIKEEAGLSAQDLDTGFRVLKLDSTNMKDVYYSADEYSQGMLSGLESNIKEERTDMDLLFGCLLEWGLPLSLPHVSEEIEGVLVHTINDGDLIACFAKNINEVVVKEIAKRQPLRAVFRDSCFDNSPEKINLEEIFKLTAPNTSVKVL